MTIHSTTHVSVRFIKTLMILTLSTSFLTGCFDSEKKKDDTSEKHLIQSTAYLQQGQFGAAMIEARNAIKNDPRAPEGHVALANCFIALGNYKSAIAQLTQISPEGNANYVLALAEAYIGRGKYRSSIQLLEENAELFTNEGRPKYLLLRGNAKNGIGEFESAISSYESAIKANPSFTDAKLKLAETYIMLDKDHQAFEYLRQMEQEDGENPDVILFKAKLALKDHNLEEGVKLLTQALGKTQKTDLMTPTRASMLSALAEVLTRLGRSADALIYTRIIANAYPGSQGLQNQYSEAVKEYREGNMEKAENLLVEILKDSPNHEKAGQLLGIINYFQGDLTDAEYYFNESLDPEISSDAAKHIMAMTSLRLQKPEEVLELLADEIDTTTNVSNIALYGVAALSSDKPEEGIKYLRKAVKLEPSRSQLNLVIAHHYNSLQPPQYEKALEEITQASKSSPDDSRLQEALVRQHMIIGNMSKAETAMIQILSKYPNQHSTHLLAGNFARYNGKLPEALKHFQKSLSLSPDSANIIFMVAKTQFELRDWESSSDTFKKFIKLEPTRIEGYRGLLDASVPAGKQQETIKYIEEQTKETPQSSALVAIGILLAKSGDLGAAETYKDKALTLSPGDARALKLAAAVNYTRGKKAKAKGNFAEAKKFALKGLQSDSNNAPLFILLAESEIDSKNFVEAAEVIKQIKAVDKYLALHLTGDLNNAQKYFASALENYQTVWDKQPTDLLGQKIYRLFGSSGHEQKAQEFLDIWIEKLPNGVRARASRSSIYINNGQFKAAKSDLEAGQKIAPNSTLILNNLAWVYQKLGDSRALAVAEKAQEISPTDPNVLDTYGWILYNEGQKDRAITILEKAASLAPSNKAIKKHLDAAKAG